VNRAALVCAVVSVLAHMGGVAVISDGQVLEVAGSAPAEARFGNSFQDIAAGSAVASPTPDAEAATPIAESDLLSPNAAVETTPHVETDLVASNPVVTVSAAAPVAPVTPADPEATLPPMPSEAITPVIPTETVTGDEPVIVSAATDETVRPRRRTDPKAEVSDPPSQRQPNPVAPSDDDGSPPAAAAGAAETERRGVAEGAETGLSSDRGADSRAATEAGNAAASSYPGVVMRKINRTRKPRVGVEGTAIVGFEIAADGQLASVRILRSSGESAVDQAALDHLRRAAPFAAPPSGAQRRFQIEYVSRG